MDALPANQSKPMTTSNRLNTIRQQSLKEKAAALLDRKPSQIISVEESYAGAGVKFKSGNSLIIPHEVWVLGWTEAEYIASRQAA